MDPFEPIICHSLQCTQLCGMRIIRVVVYSVNMDAERTILHEENFRLPDPGMSPADWQHAMEEVLAQVHDHLASRRL